MNIQQHIENELAKQKLPKKPLLFEPSYNKMPMSPRMEERVQRFRELRALYYANRESFRMENVGTPGTWCPALILKSTNAMFAHIEPWKL